jgi:hypothetical protein
MDPLRRSRTASSGPCRCRHQVVIQKSWSRPTKNRRVAVDGERRWHAYPPQWCEGPRDDSKMFYACVQTLGRNFSGTSTGSQDQKHRPWDHTLTGLKHELTHGESTVIMSRCLRCTVTGTASQGVQRSMCVKISRAHSGL